MNEPTITLTGNLTADPELRFTSTGKPVARLVVAVNPRHRGQDGQWVEDTAQFWTCQAWGQLAEHLPASLGKGDRVTVTGHVRANTWTPTEGEHAGIEQYRLDVIVDEVGLSLRFHPARTHRPGSGRPGAQANAAAAAAY